MPKWMIILRRLGKSNIVNRNTEPPPVVSVIPPPCNAEKYTVAFAPVGGELAGH